MKLPILLSAFVVSMLVLTVGAMPAWAQTTQHVSVDFAVTAHPDDWYKTPGPRSSGRTSGIAVGAGTRKVRLEFGWPTRHEINWTFGRVTTTEYRRTVSLDLLYRRPHTLGERVTVSWLVGGGFAVRAPSARNQLAAVGGLDLEVGVTRRFAILPQLRAHLYPLGVLEEWTGTQLVTFEPRIGVRWRFH